MTRALQPARMRPTRLQVRINTVSRVFISDCFVEPINVSANATASPATSEVKSTLPESPDASPQTANQPRNAEDTAHSNTGDTRGIFTFGTGTSGQTAFNNPNPPTGPRAPRTLERKLRIFAASSFFIKGLRQLC